MQHDTNVLRPIEPAEYESLFMFGQRLRQLRLAAGLTQRALAARAGLNPASLRRVEAGKRRTRRGTLTRLVAGLGHAEPRATAVLSELVNLAGESLVEDSPWTR